MPYKQFHILISFLFDCTMSFHANKCSSRHHLIAVQSSIKFSHWEHICFDNSVVSKFHILLS